MSQWVRSDHFGLIQPCPLYPESDRDSDPPGGRYVPKADVSKCSKPTQTLYSITLSAVASSVCGTVS